MAYASLWKDRIAANLLGSGCSDDDKQSSCSAIIGVPFIRCYFYFNWIWIWTQCRHNFFSFITNRTHFTALSVWTRFTYLYANLSGCFVYMDMRNVGNMGLWTQPFDLIAMPVHSACAVTPFGNNNNANRMWLARRARNHFFSADKILTELCSRKNVWKHMLMIKIEHGSCREFLFS